MWTEELFSWQRDSLLENVQVAKVFISMYGDEREQEIALEGLKSKAKYVRMGLGKRMSLRMTPEVRFVKDESLERGSRVRYFFALTHCSQY